MILEMAKFVNLALSFLLELCGLAVFGYWGYRTGNSWIWKLTLGLATPLAMAVVWGLLLAPNSSTRLSGWTFLGLQILIFTLAVVALWAVGKHYLAIILAVAVVMNQIVAYVFTQ